MSDCKEENMVKRTISFMLSLVMLLSVLTGCSTNELGYLSLSRELAALTQFSFENTTNIEVTEDVAGEDYNAAINLNGKANLDDLNSIYMDLDVTFSINGVESTEPINFIIADNNVYASKNMVLQIITFDEMLNGEATESVEVINDFYNNSLKDVEYILLSDLGEMESIEYETDYKEMQDDAIDYITTAFKGFDSKLITKINGGYSVELTSQSALEFVERLIVYVSEHREHVFDETLKYVENLYNNTEFEGMTSEDKEEIIAELEASRQDFYDFLDEAVMILETDELASLEELVRGSSIKQDVVKTGTTYKENSSVEIVFEGVSMGNLSSETLVIPENVEKTSVTENVMTIEEAESMYEKTENKINPAQTMQLMWYADGYDLDVDITRKSGKTDWNTQPYTIIENRVYLPLRYIGETFGEEVYWDNDARKAYVIRGNEKIDMTGVIVESRTMVKVRDFEKLGYKITYTLDGDISTAVIEK
jgi:hypothetical protein